MSDSTPAPVLEPVVPTRLVRASRTLWLTSFASGSIAILFAFVARDEQLGRLRDLLTGLAPDRDPDTLGALAVLVFWGTLGLLALVIVSEAVVVHVMMRRHGGARWALMFILFINAGAALVVDAFVIVPGDEGLYLRICLLAQLSLAGAGLVVSLLPGASAWFRSKRKLGRSRRS
jgi:hypothetical protein